MNVISAIIEFRYILALVCVSLYAVLCLVYLIFYVKNKKAEAERLQSVLRMYENIAGSNGFDDTPYDKETERLLSERGKDGQITIDDVIKPQVTEEITGNYKPED